jgi:hypothetical protein
MWWKRRGARGLRQVLMEEWDPIHVRDFPEAQDEYDSYLGPIAERLRSGSSPEDLAAYLDFVTEERMGLGNPKKANPLAHEANLTAARRMLEWYAEETGGSPS